MVDTQGWFIDLLARLNVDKVHLSPFPSLALVRQVHRTAVPVPSLASPHGDAPAGGERPFSSRGGSSTAI
jgi:hypothetical protein